MRHRILDEAAGKRRFVLVLDAGEEVVEALTRFAADEGVAAASVSGIGALSQAHLGWFNPATGEFRRNTVAEQAEVLAITGNIARLTSAEEGHGHPHSHARPAPDGSAVALHLHIVLGCGDASVRGGHLVEGWVSPTMELVIEEAAAHLSRGVDAVTGLVLLEPRRRGPAPDATPMEAAE